MVRSLSGKKKVAVLGAGKIGSILLQSFLRDGLLSPGQTWATVAHPERARMLKEKLMLALSDDSLRQVIAEYARRSVAAYEWSRIGLRAHSEKP